MLNEARTQGCGLYCLEARLIKRQLLTHSSSRDTVCARSMHTRLRIIYLFQLFLKIRLFLALEINNIIFSETIIIIS